MDISELLAEVEREDQASPPRRIVEQVDPDTSFETIVNDVMEEDTLALYEVLPDTPLDPHRDGYTSFYYFVGYWSPTVDGASSLRREQSLEDAPITRIALTYRQAQALDLLP